MVVISWFQNQTASPSAVKILAEIFHSIMVRSVGIVYISCTHMNGHRDVQMHVLCEKIQLPNYGAIIPGGIGWGSGWIWLKDLCRRHIFLRNFLACEANIYQNLINQTRLCHSDGNGAIQFSCMSDLDTDIARDIASIL